MKVIRAGMPDPYTIPADPKNGQPKDKRVDRVGSHNVVKVSELVKWCRDNPNVTCETLANQFEIGVFA